jgi:transcriptional regulator with XRE-family HTH domain
MNTRHADSNDTLIEISNLSELIISGRGIDPFCIKKDEVATNLSALLSFSGKNRSEISEHLVWKRSRTSRLLSGKENPTIKTIFAFCAAIGYEFSIVFNKPNEKRRNQPWEYTDHKETVANDIIDVRIQSKDQAKLDITNGYNADFYISVKINRTIDANKSDDNMLLNQQNKPEPSYSTIYALDHGDSK